MLVELSVDTCQSAPACIESASLDGNSAWFQISFKQGGVHQCRTKPLKFFWMKKETSRRESRSKISQREKRNHS
jgi:hypothetical protein